MTAVRAITRVQDADDWTFPTPSDGDPAVYDASTGGLKKGTAGSADKLGLTPTAVKTSGYTAAAGDLVPVDTTSGAVTITLPNAPADKSVVAVKHVIQGGTNAVTINCAGSDVFNKASGATSATLPLLAQGLLLQYKSSSAIWYVVADDLPLSQIDSRYWAQTTLLGAGVYGDGSDGTVTFDGSTTILGMAPSSSVYTLTRDIFLAAGTINNGVSIKTNGFRIFCQGTLTNNGTIHWNGNAATSNLASGGVGNASSSFNANIGATTNPGTAGGAGGTTTGSAGNNATGPSFGGAGGTGGTGTSGAGGAGGSIVAPTSTQGSVRFLPYAVLLFVVQSASAFKQIQGGTGGGGGGGDGTAGGGAGSGAGVVLVAARIIAGTGAIQARGGAGFTPTAGNRGGGAGGGGGLVVVVSESIIAGAITGQTIDANGGAKGSPHGTGTDNATDGAVGIVVLLPN